MSNSSNRKLRVFLCHSSKDKPAVRTLYHRLQEDGFQPWLDEKSLSPGQNWRYEIEDQVRLSDAFVVCLTRESAKRESFYQKEIKVAFDAADEKPEGTIFIIPVRLEPLEVSELPRRLRDTHWANLYEPDGYDRLVQSLRKRAQEINAIYPEVSNRPSVPWPKTVPPPLNEKKRFWYALFRLWPWFMRHRVITWLLLAGIVMAIAAEFYNLYTERAAQHKRSVLLNQQALDKWRVFDLANAHELFGQAVAADGTNTVARANFALSLKERGNDALATREGDNAAANSSHLQRPDRLWVQGIRSEVNSDWKEAAKYYERLLEVGNETEAGLRLATVQMFGGDPNAALATLNRLSETEPRVSFGKALAANFLGDFAVEINYLNKIVEVNEPLLRAATLSQRCWAYYKSDQLATAEADCTNAATLFSDKADQLGVARTLTRLALVIARRDPTSKVPMDNLDRALAITRDLHAQRDEAGVLENRANLRMDQSPTPADIEEARRDYDAAATAYLAIGEKRGYASLLNDEATCYEDLCQFENAKVKFNDAKAIFEQLGSKDAVTATANVGSMLYLLGALVDAKRALVTALRSPHESQEDRDQWAVTLGNVFREQANLGNAALCFQGARCYDDTIPLKGTGVKRGVLPPGVSDFILLRVDEGNSAAVEQLARQEVTRLGRKGSDPEDRATALATLAQVLVAEGGKAKLEEANRAVQQANVYARDCRTKLIITITGARILSHSDPQGAREQLNNALEQAKRLGLLGRSLYAKLALAETSVLSGDSVTGRQAASQLMNEAHAAGFFLVENKARDLAKRTIIN
jgi:tetratricopeptide (TPR) repeat protein